MKNKTIKKTQPEAKEGKSYGNDEICFNCSHFDHIIDSDGKRVGSGCCQVKNRSIQREVFTCDEFKPIQPPQAEGKELEQCPECGRINTALYMKTFLACGNLDCNYNIKPFQAEEDEVEKCSDNPILHQPHLLKRDMKKIIIIEDCFHCPIIIDCDTYQELTDKQKFLLRTGVGIREFILNKCPLEDYSHKLSQFKKVVSDRIEYLDELVGKRDYDSYVGKVMQDEIDFLTKII